jgi:hypothetical protein
MFSQLDYDMCHRNNVIVKITVQTNTSVLWEKVHTS